MAVQLLSPLRQALYILCPHEQLSEYMSVKCPNAGHGCTWRGTLGQSEDHLDNRCDYEEVLHNVKWKALTCLFFLSDVKKDFYNIFTQERQMNRKMKA